MVNRPGLFQPGTNLLRSPWVLPISSAETPQGKQPP
jgi:hypothetical protein